ncbi:AraC family transcriptional regulator [Shewanella surugensis]|uniref:Helix-turn-helix transcriptional regulator n=1 Tax=Shewanella surugensis TaxID=212020 RepID=A0ABT0L8A9_9GAMM|nr:helix-turn-helix transcriptional regulator [Shewanella surugensis]MCL1123625.1 helix-turn-helix transcriptional regulator [Shewanella surugensis]
MANIYPTKFSQAPLSDVFFSYEHFLPNAITPMHSHQWGQLQIVHAGVIEIYTQEQQFVAPSQYGIWVPHDIAHESYMRKKMQYYSINIMPHVISMPTHVCLLELSPILLSIMDNFHLRKMTIAASAPDKRLVHVILDQLSQASCTQAFLPTTDDRLLSPILMMLEHQPHDSTSLSEWAKKIHTTERTLARHFQDKLGVNFTEWRQRRKFIEAIFLLKKGLSIKEIALTLGYSQTTPFIILFKQYAGCTPKQYSQRLSI